MNEAANQNRTTRALERQLGTLYYERLLASPDRSAVEQEALSNLTPLQQRPREFVRDPVMLEFLGLPSSGRLLESDLERALLDHLQEFLLELGKGFAFVALKCFVLCDLKSGELTHQDIGQMDMFVRMTDGTRRGPDDDPTVGIILCTHKDASVLRFSLLHENEQLFATKYRLVLPSEDELRAELDGERALLVEQSRKQE